MLIAMTGASGFVGRATVAELKARGGRVRALLRNPSSAPEGVETVAGELASAPALQSLCEGADVLLHVAGAISAPDRATFFKINEAGSAAVAAAAAGAGVKRFIHISSLAAREPQLSAYAASKAAGETAVAGVASLIIRPPAVYGPGDRAILPLLEQMIRRFALIPGTRTQRLSLIHVQDLARLLAEACLSGDTGLQEVSDGAPSGYSWPDLLAIAAEAEGHAVTGLHVPRLMASLIARLQPGDSRREKVAELYHPDWVARGSQPPGPRISFAEGFRGTVDWYRAQGWLPPSGTAARSG